MPSPTRKLRITLVISSLSCGGAERVLVLLARGLAGLGHAVSVVTIFGPDRDFYQLPEGVERVALGLGRDTSNLVQKLTDNRQRVRALRRALEELQPDVAVSFMCQTNVLALLAARPLDVPIVVTEHFDSRRQPPPRIWARLRRTTYPRAVRVVSPAPGVDAAFAWLPAKRRAVIPNPVDLDKIAVPRGDPLPLDWPHTVVGMGRLEHEKGFDLLIEAFARVAADFPDWGLVIAGEGSRRADLDRLVADRGLADRVQLAGLVKDPFALLRASDLFVLPSRHEAFGNALVEAMACGLPVVATDCWSGPPGIFEDGAQGRLVPPNDPDAMAAAMAELMADQPSRQERAAQARRAAERFDLTKVVGQWNELLQGLLS